jgi:hypothetical protein
MKFLFSPVNAALIATSFVLASCGGGDGDSLAVSSSNLTAPVNASTASAIAGESFAFSGGVEKFGTTSPTTVTLGSASTFSVAATEGTASGNLTFGSCIFTVTASTFPATSPLALGKTVTVHPCNMTVATAGAPAVGGAAARAVSFVLEGNASQSHNLMVDVADNGTITVEGVNVGSVTLAPVTGGF